MYRTSGPGGDALDALLGGGLLDGCPEASIITAIIIIININYITPIITTIIIDINIDNDIIMIL